MLSFLFKRGQNGEEQLDPSILNNCFKLLIYVNNKICYDREWFCLCPQKMKNGFGFHPKNNNKTR